MSAKFTSSQVPPEFPDIPVDLGTIPSDKMSTYLGMELLRIFEASDNNNALLLSCVLVGFGVAGNLLLILLTVVCSSLRCKTFAIESLRALTEIALLVNSALLMHYNQYNVNGSNDQIVSTFAIFWLSAVGSALLGLLQSVRCFASYVTDGGLISTITRFVVSVLVTGAITVVMAIISGVSYVANILSFIVIGYLLYFLPFVGSFCLDLLKLCCLGCSSPRSSDPGVKYSVHKEGDDGQLCVDAGQQATQADTRQQHNEKSTAEVFAAILAGCLHTLAFAVVTMALIRIGNVFLSKSGVVLQSTIDIMSGL